MTYKLYSFYDVLDVISLAKNSTCVRPITDMHLAAVTLAAAKLTLPMSYQTKVREELADEFDENAWNTIEFMSAVNVNFGEPRSNKHKALDEAYAKSQTEGNYGFLVVPIYNKFSNGDHKFYAVWYSPDHEKANARLDGILN